MSHDSREGVVGPSTVKSEATLVFSGFCEGRAQQIRASGVIVMEKVRVPKLILCWNMQLGNSYSRA